MDKPKNTPPYSHHEVANAMYNIDNNIREMEMSLARIQLGNHQVDLISQLINDICVWEDEADDWNHNSNIFLNAFDHDPPEGPHLEKLDRIYEECLRMGIDEDSLEIIDKARQKFNRKKQQLLPEPRFFWIPRGLFVFFYVAFLWLVEVTITLAVWVAMLYGIYWLIIKW